MGLFAVRLGLRVSYGYVSWIIKQKRLGVNRDDVDLRVHQLQDLVQSAMDKHTYTVPVSNKRSDLPAEVLQAIRLRRQLRRRWQHTRDPAASRRFRAQSEHVSQRLLDVNADRWDSYLESLEVDHASVWRAAGRLKGERGLAIP